ncbi:unnamed protein product [Protopolystoma xenopodis]|uniref:Uncharacterized protein n=1 Tax=Protopolystoma xenopodis TaxID=117903 RepID=A0A3S5CQ34_9PLAT|nr:unnamed protein product [Protopolystoma xenopodis]
MTTCPGQRTMDASGRGVREKQHQQHQQQEEEEDEVTKMVPAWKLEALEKRRQREMTTDVERRWEEVMANDGEGAPDWLREAAMRRKASLQRDTTSGTAPWMNEVKRKNAGLARRMSEAQETDDHVEPSPSVQPKPTPKPTSTSTSTSTSTPTPTSAPVTARKVDK